MGFAFCVGPCFACKLHFSFNPVRVPSYRFNGTRMPVCKSCVDLANVKRKKNGLEPIIYSEDAYQPIREEELP